MKKEYIKPKITVKILEDLMQVYTSHAWKDEEGWAKKHNVIYDDEFDETDPIGSDPY